MHTRKVKVFKRVSEQLKTPGGYKSVKKLDGAGVFHEWGVDFEKFNDGIGNFSVAIVERENGKVELIEPILIEFIS